MITSAAKTLLKNHIRHADTHNRMVEESEMWATQSKLSDMDRKTGTTDNHRGNRTNSKYDQRSRRPNQFQGRNDSHDSFLYDDRDDSESPEDRCGAYMDRQRSDPVVSSRVLERSKKSRKTKQDLKAGIDRWDHSGFEKQNPRSQGQDDARWGHSGYRMMYPGDSDGDHRKKRKEERYPKLSKKKKYKKRKKKRNKHVSESEDEMDKKRKSETEKIQAAAVNTKLGSLKPNSDLMLMQRFTSEVRPKKPSQPRMKMRTWNSDSSADSNSDSKYHKDKSRKYRSKKSRRKKYRSGDSSFDSSSDSDSESEGRRKRKRVKKQRKKRRRESDETSSDSGESGPSSKKRHRSSRAGSTSESAVSAVVYSRTKYPQKKYGDNSDLTNDSDLGEKMKHDIDSDYSTARKHKKKKKKHNYR